MAKAAKKTAATGPGIGDNSNDLAEKDRKVIFFMARKDYLEALTAQKAATSKMKLVGKAIKADLGKYGLDQIKAYEQAQTPEGLAELKARRDADLQAMRFAGVPVNTQLDIFTDRAPLTERAYADGEEAGLRGDSLVNPYNEASPEGQAWGNGWHDGQGALLAGIKKKQDDATAKDEIIKSGDGDDDPFGDDEDEELEAAE
jgi:ribosome modulation factor